MELPSTTVNSSKCHHGNTLRSAHSNFKCLFCFGKRLSSELIYYWKFLMLTMVPLILMPLAVSNDLRARCGYTVLLMMICWIFQLLPLAITAFFPVILFPMFGILTCNGVAKEYFNDTIFLLIGGLIVAMAVEKSKLHERLALRTAVYLGAQPKWIMAGLMALTAGFSMFISNTATAAMMLPISQSLATQLMKMKKVENAVQSISDGRQQMEHSNNFPTSSKRPSAKDDKSMTRGLVICICFAANIGGTATLTGTPPNLVVVGQLETLYEGKDTGMNYLAWLIYAAPLMIVCLVICWLILVFYFLRNVPAVSEDSSEELIKNFKNSPDLSFAEVSVSICFALLLSLWISRKPGHLKGLADLFPDGCYSDATSAILISILLFVLPSELPGSSCEDVRGKRTKSYSTLMDWETMQKDFPWSIVVLLGGGFAMAAGIKAAGLSDFLGDNLSKLGCMSLFWLQITLTLLAMIMTNICSNTVTANIFLPIVANLAEDMGIHPFVLMLPVTIACSFAFALPVGTPSNTIVFNSGFVKIKDMLIIGTIMSLVLGFIVVGYTTIAGNLVFGLDEAPEWARSFNASVAF